MIVIAVGLAVLGLFLSALFSGSEMGFYRAGRVRLVLDALGGDPVARGLAWLTNRPSLFVATVLVGNNMANYLVSAAVVIAAQLISGTSGHGAELVAPLLLAPVLFVYGELLPKDLFLKAPNRLLRAAGPLLLVFVVLFLPISLLLWALNRLLASLVGESSEPVRLTLARRELQRVLDEGHEAGILHAAQRALAQGIFALANEPVGRRAASLDSLPRARADMTKPEILALAKRHGLAELLVQQTDGDREVVGYLRVVDLTLDPSNRVEPRRLLTIPETETHIAALARMEEAGEGWARVVDASGKTLGILTAKSLREPLFRGR